ncbi:hypothetical protein SDC9_62785 [bioreactor metagenome]|uniref:DNA-directed DNA polymerase n=1 Tax=bioreactor metagenome TaxID=1076179 RepID=A0A644XJN2_9ZZZZ
MYQALYRKWRPRTFDDVVGQSHITETLKRQVATGRTSHAYLFTGTRGTGKTTCAKILARAVNCEAPVDGNPCNRCPSCLGIENGSILDVLELDAASNNGVDQVRALRDEAIYTPAAVKKRVYIVDEVHMLSTAAFNALLKILEEPPSHLMFILATTELHKVPATIKSRCQQFAFRRILPGDIAGRLSFIAAQEGIELTGSAAELLSRLADGGLRDAISLLDQCAVSGARLGREEVLAALGLAGNLETAEMMSDITERNAEGALSRLADLYAGGKDLAALLGELSSLARDLLVRKTAPRAGAALLTGGYDEAVLRPLLEKLSIPRLSQILGVLQTASAELPRSTNRRLDMELCLIRLCDESLDGSTAGLEARITRLENALDGSVLTAARPQRENPPEKEKAAPEQTSRTDRGEDPDSPPWEESPPEAREQKPSPEARETQREEAEREDTPRPAKPSPAVEDRGSFWPTFVASLQGRVPPMAMSFLKNPDLAIGTYLDGVLTIWVESDLVRGTLSKPDTLAAIEGAAGIRFGAPARVNIAVGKPQESAKASSAQQKNLDDLRAMSRRLGNITIKE